MSLEALRRQVEGDPQSAEDLVTRLKAHQHDPIRLHGTWATMPYDGLEFEMVFPALEKRGMQGAFSISI